MLHKPGVRLDCRPTARSWPARRLSPLSTRALDLVGPLSMRPATRQALIDYVTPGGELRFETGSEEAASQRVSELLQLIVATREYQLN